MTGKKSIVNGRKAVTGTTSGWYWCDNAWGYHTLLWQWIIAFEDQAHPGKKWPCRPPFA